MACDVSGVIAGAFAQQGVLDSFSRDELLRALYEVMCTAWGGECDPRVYLDSLDPCVACLSEQELLAGIVTMRCAQGGIVAPVQPEDAWSSGFGPGFGGGQT